jgi:ABC-type glycerol-3-phosphate transport system permease component
MTSRQVAVTARRRPRAAWQVRSAALRWTGLVALLAFTVVPVVAMALGSVSPAADLYRTPPSVIPSGLTDAWYREVLRGAGVPRWMVNSLVVALVTTVVNAIVGVTGAYATVRFRFPGRSVLVTAFLLSYLFPAVLLVLPLSSVIQSLGLAGTLVAVIVAHCAVTVPFSVWLMRAFLIKIPEEIEAAARLDGCNAWQVFTQVALPLSRGGLIATSTFAFILSWNEYLFASVLSSGKTATLPVGIAQYVTSFDVRIGAILAVGTLATVPVLIVFAIFQRYVEAGLLQAGVKE